jgi:hypothetical protein
MKTALALTVALLALSSPAFADEAKTGASPYQPYGAGAPAGWNERHQVEPAKLKPCPQICDSQNHKNCVEVMPPDCFRDGYPGYGG